MRSAVPTFEDPALAQLPFTDRCYCASTDYLPRLPSQVPPADFTPTSLRDILEDVVLDEMIPNWLRPQLADLVEYKTKGSAATRAHNRVLAIGQSHFKPQAWRSRS